MKEEDQAVAGSVDSVRPTRFVASVGTTIGLCILGDSLMYSLLPLEAANLGIALPLVGLLLSINRLVRLFSNSWASALFERWGPARPFLGSIFLGVATTASYAFSVGFWLFLSARALWGVAWSGQRQGGYVAIWTGPGAQKGRLTGLLWGIVRLGSASSVLIGGLLYDRFGYQSAAGAIALMSLLAIPAALTLPWAKVRTENHRGTRSVDDTESDADAGRAEIVTAWLDAWRDRIRRRLTLSTAVQQAVEGIVLSTTSLFIAQRLVDDGSAAQFGIGVGTVAGLLLGTRWVSDILLGPLFGHLSDRVGQARLAVTLTSIYVVALIGVVGLPVGPAIGALLVVFLCGSGIYVSLNAAATGEAMQSRRPHRFVGVFTTAADAGSALGPLIAFSVTSIAGFSPLYVGSGLLLFMTISWYWWGTRSQVGAV